jgi:hypothetical protein
MTCLLYVGMVAAFLAMLFVHYRYRQQASKRYRRLSIGFGILAGVLSITSLYVSWNSPGPDDEDRYGHPDPFVYTLVAHEALGNYLVKSYPGKTVLLLEQNVTELNYRQKMIHDALRTGVDGRAPMTFQVFGQPYDPSDPAKLVENALGIYDFEAFLSEHVPGYAEGSEGDPRDVVVVSLVGLPLDQDEMDYWNRPAERRPHLVLVNAYLRGLQQRIADGQIEVVLAHNPDATYDPIEDYPPPTNLEEAFAKRYLFITYENVAAMAAEHPMLFGDVE